MEKIGLLSTGMQPIRLPASPADLMMRIVNLIVDNYLDLRRELSRHALREALAARRPLPVKERAQHHSPEFSPLKSNANP